MMKPNTRKSLLGLSSMAVGVGIVLLAGYLNAQDSDSLVTDASVTESTAALTVGTYDLQSVFEQSPAQEQMMRMVDSVQEEMQTAQEEGAMETIQQIQQQFEMRRTQVINQFHSDVAQASPELAQEAGVQVVALEIQYTADDVEVKDLTSQLVASLKELAEDDDSEEEEEDATSLLQFMQ